ncbi:hypothetical protein ILYODFUR_024162 [Ilyodon furcidens]|uniref:Uncharacterized protein n=1 Tax=Ilyodon furcidens TaxID=33524 RepID=A0ABV0SNU1_9TELE
MMHVGSHCKKVLPPAETLETAAERLNGTKFWAGTSTFLHLKKLPQYLSWKSELAFFHYRSRMPEMNAFIVKIKKETLQREFCRSLHQTLFKTKTLAVALLLSVCFR